MSASVVIVLIYGTIECLDIMAKSRRFSIILMLSLAAVFFSNFQIFAIIQKNIIDFSHYGAFVYIFFGYLGLCALNGLFFVTFHIINFSSNQERY